MASRWAASFGASIALIKFDKGAGIPQPHLHAANQFMFCLKGKYEYTSTGVVLTVTVSPHRGVEHRG